MAPATRALIAFGTVRHLRLRPVRHAFTYPTYFLLLPLRSLRRQPEAALPRNRFGLIAFHDADHGDGRGDALAWLDELLAGEGIDDAQGEVWLQAYPRVLGYAFKPVSFWYAHRSDGSLAAIVAEVNNTFGERHCYLLSGDGLGWGSEQTAAKVFHVSPFCAVSGRYRFRFMRSAHPAATAARKHPDATGHLVARIDHDDDEGLLLQTRVSGTLVPLDAASLRRAFRGMPLMTLTVIARIHWQALQLWCKRVPFFGKPVPPRGFVTR
ncbi:MAG: DUF1365 domain-containing protein [Methylibium sp.]|uniref:DUF1365 domain-containing protein n=1 Tax=Methylibium sp. TaxID=2067992 RepID=UPI0017933B09|nr:DUF1365 domain-containing protein [Methylibium sp.]MBA3596676.1 DUF1365 domain-containing protein [Methylibium sp.]